MFRGVVDVQVAESVGAIASASQPTHQQAHEAHHVDHIPFQLLASKQP